MKYRVWGCATISVVCVIDADSDKEAETKASNMEPSDIPCVEIAQYLDPDGKWHFHEGSKFAIVEEFEAEEIQE